jgi:hypothetical protein
MVFIRSGPCSGWMALPLIILAAIGATPGAAAAYVLAV